jgi:cytochrome c5
MKQLILAPVLACALVAFTGAAHGAQASEGQTVFAQNCAVCHGPGVAGAPRLGDKAEWGPRIAQGKDTLYTHALQGFTGQKGTMPPKGGNTTLSDADVKAAVDYMAGQAQ